MKKQPVLLLVFLLLFSSFLFPSMSFSQERKIWDKFFERVGPRIQHEDLKVLKLGMSPDPVRPRQWVSFQAVISNASNSSGKISLFVKDADEVITEVHDVLIRPGQNQVIFPQSNYRFSRSDHCFSVELDIDRTRRPIDLSQEFCAYRTRQGWTLAEPKIGPLFVADLDMEPDPIVPGQEFLFMARIRNRGKSVRGDIRIQDRDQVVVQLNNALIHKGFVKYYFPQTRLSFQRLDHCFTVVVDVDKTPYEADAEKEFCLKPTGWTLKP